MNRTRIMLAVYMDLDPVPGAFHTADNTRSHVNNMLKERVPHYSPLVSIVSYGGQLYNFQFDHNNKNFNGGSPEYNMLFIKGALNHSGEMLVARGYLFLNEVLENLGFPHTREGQLVGWTADGPLSWDPKYNFDNGNVDISFWTEGVIIDKAFEEA